LYIGVGEEKGVLQNTICVEQKIACTVIRNYLVAGLLSSAEGKQLLVKKHGCLETGLYGLSI